MKHFYLSAAALVLVVLVAGCRGAKDRAAAEGEATGTPAAAPAAIDLRECVRGAPVNDSDLVRTVGECALFQIVDDIRLHGCAPPK